MSFSMDTAFVGSWSMHYEREAWLSGVYREDQAGIIGVSCQDGGIPLTCVRP